MLRKAVGEMSSQEWLAPRQTIFNNADFNNDGVLDKTEAEIFL